MKPISLRRLSLAGVLALGLASAAQADDDSLLKLQRVPSNLLPMPQRDGSVMLQFDSYGARMENLRSILPCPIRFPDQLEEFVHEKSLGTDWNKGKTFFLGERNGVALMAGATFADLLNNSAAQLRLIWHYDAVQKAIATDFVWHVAGQRTGAQDAEYLATHAAAKTTYWPAPSKDPWTEAFNALLSRPENFPRVWRLRFTADDRMGLLFATSWVKNLVAGKITDATGRVHLIVVNDQEELANPGPPGSISYYLFDFHGRFESGGIYTVGYRCFGDSAWLDRDGRRLWVETWNNGSQKRDLIFEVEKGQLVRKDFLVDGQKPPNEWPWTDVDEGKSVFTVDP